MRSGITWMNISQVYLEKRFAYSVVAYHYSARYDLRFFRDDLRNKPFSTMFVF